MNPPNRPDSDPASFLASGPAAFAPPGFKPPTMGMFYTLATFIASLASSPFFLILFHSSGEWASYRMLFSLVPWHIAVSIITKEDFAGIPLLRGVTPLDQILLPALINILSVLSIARITDVFARERQGLHTLSQSPGSVRFQRFFLLVSGPRPDLYRISFSAAAALIPIRILIHNIAPATALFMDITTAGTAVHLAIIFFWTRSAIIEHRDASLFGTLLDLAASLPGESSSDNLQFKESDTLLSLFASSKQSPFLTHAARNQNR